MSGVVEVRFRVRDTGDFKKAVQENSKEAEGFINKIKAAGKTVGQSLHLPLKDARKIFAELGMDTKRFEAAMRQAGVPLRDARLLAGQLNKEMNEGRRAVLGFDQGAGKLAKSLREGVFAGEAMHRVFDQLKGKVETLGRLGKIKGLEESTADAIELQKQYDKLAAKLQLTNNPAAKAELRKNIQETSVLNNIPQSTLIDSVIKAQETKSAGRELALDKGGALLKQLTKTAYGDYMEPGEVPDYVASQVITLKNLKLGSAADLARIQGITRAGEEVGALTASNIATKGGKITSQLMNLQGTTGELAYRRGQALLQTIGDAPGIDGDTEVAVNRAENLLAKLADPKTRERIQEATGFDPLTKEGRMRPLTEIFAGFERAEKEGKLALPKSSEDLDAARADPKKRLKYKTYYEIFHDMQAREGEFAVRANLGKLRALENVDPNTGLKIIEEGYNARIGSNEGQLSSVQMRDAVTHVNTLQEKFGYIAAAANVMSSAQANSPKLSAVAGVAGDIAGVAGPNAKLMTEAALANALVLGNIPTDARTPIAQKEHAASMVEGRQAIDAAKARVAALQKELAAKEKEAKDKGIDLTVNVNVQEGQTATVTTSAKKTKQASQSGTRKPTKPGQS